jgi:hypothetical protein
MEWGGGMECEKPQRSLFYFAFFISNIVLFISSFEIFANTENVGVNIQCRYCISNLLDVCLFVLTTYIGLTWSDS